MIPVAHIENGTKAPTMISLPIRAPKEPNGYAIRDVPLIEPHRLFHELFMNVGVTVPAERVHNYWKTHREELKEDWAMQSPASCDHIPFALYGDGCKIMDDGTKVVGLFLSMPAVWRPQSSRCGLWCIFALEEHKCYGYHTMHTILRHITCSCSMLFEGRADLVGGRKFCITELKGDWQFLKQELNFRSNWNRLDACCFLCTAKIKSANPKDLFYALEDQNWVNYDLISFLVDQLGHCANPSFLAHLLHTVFCAVCIELY